MSEAQRVVDTGPYAHIRHPGYAGTLTMLLGYAMAWKAPAAALPLVPMLPLYIRRITAEERLLVAELGEPYIAYRERSSGSCLASGDADVPPVVVDVGGPGAASLLSSTEVPGQRPR